jgi:hypothetical protein
MHARGMRVRALPDLDFEGEVPPHDQRRNQLPRVPFHRAARLCIVYIYAMAAA